MGLLDQLWDDTVAGPPPLGKLRKYNSFSPSSSSSAAASAAAGAVQVTCSITILRTRSSSSSASFPRSPSSRGSAAPDSLLTPPGQRGDWKRLRRKPAPTAAEGMETAEPRSPTVYDWVVISSLDR